MRESFTSNQSEELKESWREIEQMLDGMRSSPIEGVNISKVKHQDSQITKAVSQEIFSFYSSLFEGEENADPMQLEIGIESGIVDVYIARDAEGKIISLLQSQNLEILSPKSGKPELMFLVWYVATDKNYRGKPVTRNLFHSAVSDLLERSKKESKPITAFLGETEEEVEGLFNRYGLSRIYYKDKEGMESEVPFESPPEDESIEGVPEHLMVRLLNGRTELSQEELMAMVDSIYSQYTRPEYFSVEYLKFVEEFYGESDGAPINSRTAELYYSKYKEIVADIRKKLEKSVQESNGQLFLKKRRDRRAEEI